MGLWVGHRFPTKEPGVRVGGRRGGRGCGDQELGEGESLEALKTRRDMQISRVEGSDR